MKKAMGVFRIRVTVYPVGRTEKQGIRLHQVLVDTGSEATWLPERHLKKLGIAVFKKDQPFIMANGERITRDVGIAIIQANGFKTVDEVVFAKPGDLSLLGARTLEGFHATVDPRLKKLVAAGPPPAA